MVSRWQDSEVNAQSSASLYNNFICFLSVPYIKRAFRASKLLPQLHSQYFFFFKQPIKSQYLHFLKAAFMEHCSYSTLKPQYCTIGVITRHHLSSLSVFSLSFCPYLTLQKDVKNHSAPLLPGSPGDL